MRTSSSNLLLYRRTRACHLLLAWSLGGGGGGGWGWEKGQVAIFLGRYFQNFQIGSGGSFSDNRSLPGGIIFIIA